MRSERVKELKDVKDKAEAKSKKQIEESNKKIQALQKRVCMNRYVFALYVLFNFFTALCVWM